MRRVWQLLAMVVVLGVVGVALALLAARNWLSEPVAMGVDSVMLQPGDNLYSVSRRLPAIDGEFTRRIWIAHARLTGATNIKQGEYDLPPLISPAGLLQMFNDGKVKQRTFTWVEGITVSQALAVLRSQSYLAEAQPALSMESLRAQLQLDYPNAEGWLFPDTYHYSRDASPWELIRQSYQRMQSALDAEWEGRAPGLPYNSPYEALIMASIIEKETGAPEERAEIAGVFVRRLQKGMRLQTDPTVIYGLGEEYQGNIRRKHLRQPTPYNTYVIKGLPPTPIALPGREAIHAALHPAEGETLFFVAKGDGTHQFSVTLQEHEAAVRAYQLKRAENYRSSPAQ